MDKNVLDSLKSSPTTPVQVHEQDPNVVAGVKEFLAAHQVALEADGQQRPRTHVEPDPMVGAKGPDDAFVREALVPVDNIEVTDEEKRIYLKSLLTDTLTRFPIKMYGGEITYSLRSRSVFEQRRTLDILDWQMRNDELLKNNVAKQFDLIQQYFALIMVERINDKLFSELKLEEGYSIEEDYAKLEKTAKIAFSKMNNVIWTAMLNSMRMFEAKCAKLAENAVNEDFWKPRS